MDSHVEYHCSASLAVLRHCRDPYIGLEGRRGTSKTRGILSELLLRLLEYPGCRILLAMENRSSLSERVLTTFEEQVLPAFKMKTPGGQSREGRTTYDMPNGSQFIPIGLKETVAGQAVGGSLEATFAYVAEATLCTRKQVTDLLPSLRYLKDKSRPTLPEWSQILVDFNPVDPGNWVNRWMEPAPDILRRIETREDYARLQRHNWTCAAKPLRHPKRVITTHQDNPGYWDQAAWEYTPLGRQYVTQILETLTGFQRARWLDGRWVAAEGGVFPEFTAENNVVPAFKVPAHWPVWRCIDPGYNHPCGVSWHTLSPNGTMYCIAEIKVRETGMDVLLEMIRGKGLGITRGFLDPYGANQRWQVSGGKTFQTILRERGISDDFWPAAQLRELEASVEDHRQAVKAGRYKVFDTCPEMIAEHQSWRYKTVRDGELPLGDDAFEDRNNDLIDGVLGLERTHPKFTLPVTAWTAPPQETAAAKPQVAA